MDTIDSDTTYTELLHLLASEPDAIVLMNAISLLLTDLSLVQGYLELLQAGLPRDPEAALVATRRARRVTFDILRDELLQRLTPPLDDATADGDSSPPDC
jgi:hypothetical protein